MTTKRETKMKTVTVTVGDLIAAVFDVVGDQVDGAVDLLRFNKAWAKRVVVVPNSPRPQE